MRFIAYSELIKALGFSNVNDEDLDSESLKRTIQDQLSELKHIDVAGRKVSQNELFDLISLYDSKENKVFSDWVLSDEVLSSFLDERLNQQFGEVKKYENHFLEAKYKAFISRFLFAKLRTETRTGIQSDNLIQLALYLELSSLLAREDKFIVQQQVANYIEKKLVINSQGDHATINQLVTIEFSTIIEKLEDSFYALKVNYVKTLKNQLEDGRISRSKAQGLWKQIGLNKAHLAELENYMDTLQETFPKTKRRSFISLVKNPAFIFSTLLVVVLILLFLPSNGKQEIEILEVQQKRSGLDSLSKGEVIMADTILGYNEKEDSSTLENIMTPDM